MVDLDGITVVTEPSEASLNQRQLLDYRSQRKACLSWLLAFGKNPSQAEGYARSTVRTRAHRMDQFYRWVWEQYDGYTVNVTHDHADAWLKELALEDSNNVHKSNCRKALKMLFKWRHHEHDVPEWEPAITFSLDDSASNPRDYLTRDERRKIREVALEYGSIPSYNDLTPEQRKRWRAHLAQRFEKPKEDVQQADWKRANGWKIPSLVWTSLDAGLRPVEVERAVTSWVDTENAVLRIPKSESSKNYDNWVVGLQERTADVLERWLEERDAYNKYTDTDALWLTREENRYGSSSLRYLLRQLCKGAGISTENRQMSWYAIRHSTGTYMTRQEDLAATQAQLRHKSAETTMKYDQTPVEDRRRALDQME